MEQKTTPATKPRGKAKSSTEFGKRFQKLLAEKGRTAKSVADDADLHISVIYYYMAGLRLPSTQTIFRLAKALDMEPADVIKLVDDGDFGRVGKK